MLAELEDKIRADQLEIKPEDEADWWEVEALYDLCFAPGRTALSSYRLRDGVDPIHELCLVARDSEKILAGAIRVWPVKAGQLDALILGPIAVHPTRQGEGLGALLIRQCVASAMTAGWTRMLLVGDQKYYGRFGFSKVEALEMPAPTNPDRVLGLGDWSGVAGKVRRHA